MKKKLALFLFIVLFSRPLLADDTGTDCSSYPNIPINVVPRFDEPTYNFNLDLETLQSLAKDSVHNVHAGHKGLTLGLTRYEPILEIRIPVKGVVVDGGLACAHVEQVDVSFGYKDVTVFIPREVPSGSCGFREVMFHEQKHIAVNRQILKEFTPIIEEKLQAYLKLNGVFREENMDYAADLLQKKIRIILNEIALQITTENIRRQELVDSPEEYRRVSATCNGELRQTATQYLRSGH